MTWCTPIFFHSSKIVCKMWNSIVINFDYWKKHAIFLHFVPVLKQFKLSVFSFICQIHKSRHGGIYLVWITTCFLLQVNWIISSWCLFASPLRTFQETVWHFRDMQASFLWKTSGQMDGWMSVARQAGQCHSLHVGTVQALICHLPGQPRLFVQCGSKYRFPGPHCLAGWPRFLARSLDRPTDGRTPCGELPGLCWMCISLPELCCDLHSVLGNTGHSMPLGLVQFGLVFVPNSRSWSWKVYCP